MWKWRKVCPNCMLQLFLQMLLIKAGDTPKEVEVDSSQFFICSTLSPLPSVLPKAKPLSLKTSGRARFINFSGSCTCRQVSKNIFLFYDKFSSSKSLVSIELWYFELWGRQMKSLFERRHLGLSYIFRCWSRLIRLIWLESLPKNGRLSVIGKKRERNVVRL